MMTVMHCSIDCGRHSDANVLKSTKRQIKLYNKSLFVHIDSFVSILALWGPAVDFVTLQAIG